MGKHTCSCCAGPFQLCAASPALLPCCCCRVYVCLPSPVLSALSSVLKVLSDNTAEVFVNGAKAYTDPVADHETM
jgi:hypothetical protein